MPRIISFSVGKITHGGMKEMNGISPLQEVLIVHILQILHTCVCIKMILITPLQEVPGRIYIDMVQKLTECITHCS